MFSWLCLKQLWRGTANKSLSEKYSCYKLQAVPVAHGGGCCQTEIDMATSTHPTMSACHAHLRIGVLAQQGLPGGHQAGGSDASAAAGPWDTPLHSPQALLAHAWQVGQGHVIKQRISQDVSDYFM